MATEFLIIRHGQSIGNEKEIYIGRIDWDLSSLGYKQAEETARALSGEKIDAVYSSSLLRAMNTARPHARMRSLPVIPRDDLMEVGLGEWEGIAVSVLKEQDEFIHGWCENFGTFTTPGGECVQDAATRFYNAIVDIARENENKRVLVAAHAAVIRAFWSRISGVLPEEVATRVKFPLNASVTRVVYDGERVVPVSYSDTSHLDNDASSSGGGKFGV